MENNIYILNWYGPFSHPSDVIEWEKKQIGNGRTYLYLFKGKKKNAKTKEAIYCGQAARQTAGERLSNKKHHINEVIARKEVLSIWVAKFANRIPKKYDINLAEKMLTSILDQIIKTDRIDVLNKINKLRPRDTAYIINEWYHTNGNAILRYPNNEMCNYFPDVLACYTDEDENTSHIWGNRRMHFIKDIK